MPPTLPAMKIPFLKIPAEMVGIIRTEYTFDIDPAGGDILALCPILDPVIFEEF
jgi:hypothetical protein